MPKTAAIASSLPFLHPFLLTSDLHTLCHVCTKTAQHVLLAHPVLLLLLGEHKISYNTTALPFRAAVLGSLGVTGNLDQLHHLLPSEPVDWKRRGTHGSERWLRNISTLLWKKNGGQKSSHLMRLYANFMLDVIAPILRELGEHTMYYSKIPLLRTHFPSPLMESEGSSSSSSTTLTTPTTTKQSRRRGCQQPGVSTKRHTDGR